MRQCFQRIAKMSNIEFPNVISVCDCSCLTYIHGKINNMVHPENQLFEQETSSSKPDISDPFSMLQRITGCLGFLENP